MRILSTILWNIKRMRNLDKELKDLEKAGINSPSTSNFASPVIIFPKKKDPTTHKITYRMVVDFRKMNEQLEC